MPTRAARKTEPVMEGQEPFIITPSAVAHFDGLRDKLARLAVELSQTASDAASVAATRLPGAVTATVTNITDAPKRGRGRPRKNHTYERNDTVNPTTNVPTFDSLLQVARDLGAQAGQGKDTQIKFDLKIIEAAYLGGLSLDPNKHGTDRRDGIVLAEEYTKAQTGATVFDSKAPAGRKLISNIDKCIKLGANPKWGNGEPLSTVNSLVSHRQTMRKDPTKVKQLDDAHNMLMRFATVQLKRDTLIDGDELKAFAFKKQAEPRTAEEVLEAIRKMANNLKAGKVNNCPDLDNSGEVQSIINACTKRLTAIAKARGAANGPNASQAA